MDEMYDYMNRKLDEMRRKGETKIVVDFVDFAKMYELVCFMKQIRHIINGNERRETA